MSQSTLREQLETAYSALEEKEEAVPIEPTPTPIIEAVPDKSGRDEQGRFVAKTEKVEIPEPVITPDPVRPTTWKKEYLPLWDKMAQGLSLTADEAKQLAKYTEQRENEYKTGVSTYKSEAQNAKQLQDAMTPFVPLLQQSNIQPAEWITNLGRAHQALALGSPEQKLQMFAKLAQDYGIPLQAVAQTQQGQPLDANTSFLMQHFQNLDGQVKNLAQWREQYISREVNSELAAFSANPAYPHFEALKEPMAQLLESGQAGNLDDAYWIALAKNKDLRESLTKLPAAPTTQQAVQKAKSKAVSTKSSTPSGTGPASNTKDRRSLISEAYDASDGRV